MSNLDLELRSDSQTTYSWATRAQQPSLDASGASSDDKQAIFATQPPAQELEAAAQLSSFASSEDPTSIQVPSHHPAAFESIATMDPYDPEGLPGSQDGFGDMAIFDANASQIPASSIEGDGRKHKRDKKHKHKKSKKDKHGDLDATPDLPVDDAQEPSVAERSLDVDEEARALAEQLGSMPSPTQPKRKRSSADGSGGKRKKKKTRSIDATPDDVIEEDGEDDERIPATSSGAQAEPDADIAATMDLEDASVQPQGNEMDVASLAIEAFNEHMNGHANGVNNAVDYEVPTAVMEEPMPVPSTEPQAAEALDTSPKQHRSAKSKKAKPTFFEQPTAELAPEDDDVGKDAMWDMPSPSAAAPKPRRAKPSSKKGKGRQKLAHSMHGASDGEDGEAAPRPRRAKAEGFVQGRFSDLELDGIRQAVEQYRDDSGKTQHEVNEMIHAPGGTTAGEEHRQLWDMIFEKCPDRYRQKIINVTRKNFHNFVARGTWTPEQEAELRYLIDIHGTKWSQIAGLINRHPEDIRDRYRNYIVCGDRQRKDAWTEEEESRLTQYFIEAAEAIDDLRRSQPDRELLKKSYEELIDWQNISERMDRTRSRLQCITKWKAMNLKTNGKDKVQALQPNSQITFKLEKARRQLHDMPETERYRLVLAIQGTAAGTESKIPWQKLIDKQFRTRYKRPTQFLLWTRLKQTIPGHESKTVRDIAQELVHRYEQDGSLPAVDDDSMYDVHEERELLSRLSSTGGAMAHPSTQHDPNQLSAEFVMNSDDEGPAGAPTAAPEPTLAQEMQIDPALIAAAAVEPLEAAASLQAAQALAAATMETPQKKPKKVKKAKKSAVEPSQDPIEDLSQVPMEQEALPEATLVDDEIDESQLRGKKKRSGKFKSSEHKDAALETGLPLEPASDSVMDDMEDVPARVSPNLA
ncbi:hypothetical protein NLU13_8615 [Sarocladium strictum]|uniref:Uncharacterized protein n=1 Tax=Sarocladium strictum TaxID=5046 RepID=A0AA39G9S9_SARSR|nr:hypothetical protein NLU13_9950 [Sarocladium strictum]KAK0384529.1 hypothetical protein NLU13_8615 [Sarocladium strictum]